MPVEISDDSLDIIFGALIGLYVNRELDEGFRIQIKKVLDEIEAKMSMPSSSSPPAKKKRKKKEEEERRS